MKQLGVKYGVIAGLVYIIGTLVQILTGSQSGNQLLSSAINIVMFAATFYVVYLAVKEFRDAEGFMTAGKGIRMGITVAFIAALISSVFSLIYFNVIDPGYWDAQLEAMEDSWVDQGMSDEQIEQMSRFTGILKNPFLTTSIGIIWIVFWGLIKGAISGSILKQDAPLVVDSDTESEN